MEGGSDGGGGAAFARTLSALKERGSTLLVVGTVLEDGHVAVCDRLLGDAGTSRRRLLVRTDGECGAIPDADGGEQTVLVGKKPGLPGPDSVDAPADETVGLDPLEDLERAAVDAIDELTEAGDEPEPGDLRLCVDSLRPLLAAHPEQRVGRFVEHLGRPVSTANGISHFHLPAGSDDRYVEALEPLVDGVVEVRAADGTPQQRWQVLDGTADSGWVPL